ncbi:autotransporter assembly complex protein TamA [Sphingobium aquiterrae]|uniref:autotransporter assembly complex protein TamA n=1 Tax=Sphingobium aquiterrae TaxID=2038656 RepID=UPI003AFB0CE0
MPSTEDLSGPAPDPQSPLQDIADIGVAWPDMGQADSVQPIAPTPEDVATQTASDTAAQVQAQTQTQAPVDTPVDAPVDTGAGGAATPAPSTPVDVATDADVAEPGQPPAAVADGEAINAERRYTVQLTGVDEIADAQFTQRFGELSVLKQGEGKVANLAQINRRIKEDQDVLDRLMRAKGYYNARIRGSVASPAAGGNRLAVTMDVVPGTLYTLASVEVQGLESTGEHEPKLREAFPVKVGDPINADAIVAAQGSLATALGENGFPFAKVQDPEIRVDHEEQKGDLDIVIAPGSYRTFGKIVVTDDSIFSARHVQRIARFDPGDPYMASDLQDLRRALVQTGLVSSVTLTPKDAGDGTHVDTLVDVTPAPYRTVAGEIGYGTGEGFRLEGSWQHRNFFPPEGAITVRGVAATQEQSGSVTYRRGNFKKRDQVLTGLFSISNINRNAYAARTVQVSGTLERQTNIIFQKKWVWSVGAELLASNERDGLSRIAGGGRRTYLIGALPGGLTYDGSDDLLNPTKGFRLGARISPELSFQNSTFGYVVTQVDGSIYQPVNDRVVVAARTRLGSILGSSASRIAPSRRFYAGGGGSVRGYGYQDIGPRDANNDPIGGKSLAEFSLETRVRFGNFGVVPFVDAGNISTSFLPRFRDLRIGAGVGARYYSNFGPIRIDVGTPINPQKGDPRIAVYVSLGQAF